MSGFVLLVTVMVVGGQASSALASGSIVTRLSANKEAVEVVSLPEGTGLIKVAVMKNLAGEGLKYSTIPATQKSYTPAPATPVVDMQAATSKGVAIGNWAGRLQTVPGGAGPTVSSVSPGSGPAAGATAVAIKGSGFLAGATVKIGNPATSVSVVSETEIKATTSATAAGADEVSVTDSKGTSTGGPSYTYVAPPTSSAPPTITGTAQQGQTLTEHHGSWTNEPTGFAYQWLQCTSLGEGCLPIAGATSQTYVAVAGDVGHKLAVEETASNGGGTSSPASSLATPVVAPLPLANTAYPGLEVNFEPGEPQVWEEDKEAGALVGRAGGSLLADAKAASTAGMKLNFVLASALPTSLPTKEANEAESKYPGTLLSIEWGNESYYNGANGKEYAKSFVQAEKEQQTAKLSMPLIMQARLAPDNTGTWMKEVVAYEGIKAALIGNGTAAAPQNWIDSHPYGASMMLPQIRPTVLTESASAYEDTGKNTWGSERWMKEEYFIEKELGISNLPVALTEYGCAVKSTEGNACGSTGEAGYIEKTERAQHYFAFVQKVKEGAVTEGLPTAGWKPTLAFASWFEEVTGIEGFGVYSWNNGTEFFKNEQDGFYRKFKEAAEAVTKAP